MIKKSTVDWEVDEIASKGWSEHLRDMGDNELHLCLI